MNFELLLKKFNRNVVDHGLSSAIKKSLLYSVKAFYDQQIYRIYAINLKDYNPKSLVKDDFSYKLIGVNDSGLIQQVEEMEEWLDGMLKEKLESGGLCLVALDKDTVAGFNLAAFGKVFMPLVNTHRDFRNGNALSEQITVNNNYRGKGLGASLRYNMFSELKNRGVRKYYGGTLSDNEPNLKLTRKVGFKEIADIHYSKVLRNSNWTCTRVR
jgi:L-amino acid N-acyltransferase YncA